MEEATINLDFSQELRVLRSGGGAVQITRIPRFFLYGEPPNGADEHALHIETIAARSRQYDWKIRPHTHRGLHQLLFIAKGGGTAQAETTTVSFRPPTLIIVPAGTVHAFSFVPGTRGYVASFGDTLMRDLARREPGITSLFDAAATLELSSASVRSTDLEHAFAMFLREFGRNAVGRTAVLESLLTVILANVLRLSRLAGESSCARNGRHLLLVGRYRSLVDSWFRKGAALADYARALNVSESRLREACLRITGQPPMQLVYARILLEARRQLLYTNRSVAEIAYDLGFEDPAYFTRFFSRRTGMSPRAFRARAPAEQTSPTQAPEPAAIAGRAAIARR